MCILLQFLKLNKISRIKCIVIIHLRNLFPHLLLHPPPTPVEGKEASGTPSPGLYAGGLPTGLLT